MLLVEHYVSKSPIHGLGVFILGPVKKGSLVWAFARNFDIEIPGSLLADLTGDDAAFLWHHAEYFPDIDVFRLGNDGDMFMNHSASPSLLDFGEVMVAARDLMAGEELTCDYRTVRVLGFGGHIKAGEGCADLVGHGLPGLGVDVWQDHVGPFIAEGAGDSSTNASGTPGY